MINYGLFSDSGLQGEWWGVLILVKFGFELQQILMSFHLELYGTNKDEMKKNIEKFASILN
jgi:hypothetical protein